MENTDYNRTGISGTSEHLNLLLREAMQMETWWLRYFSLLHVLGVVSLLVWVVAIVPSHVPASFRLFVLLSWPCVLASCIYAGARHSHLAARARELQVEKR